MYLGIVHVTVRICLYLLRDTAGTLFLWKTIRVNTVMINHYIHVFFLK